MNDSLKSWWRGRSGREQGLLILMAALAAAILSWLLIVRPLNGAIEDGRARHQAAVIALAKARAEAEAIREYEAAPATEAALPVDSLISRTAMEAGFADARITSQGPSRATIAIAAARPQAFFGWVARMEQSGLIVETLRAQANSDRTISAEATFRARAR